MFVLTWDGFTAMTSMVPHSSLAMMFEKTMLKALVPAYTERPMNSATSAPTDDTLMTAPLRPGLLQALILGRRYQVVSTYEKTLTLTWLTWWPMSMTSAGS